MTAGNPVSYESDVGESQPLSGFTNANFVGPVEDFLEGQRHRLALFVPVAIGTGIGCWFLWGGEGGWRVAALCFLLIAAAGFLDSGSYLRRCLVTAAVLIGLGFIAISLRASLIAPDTLEKPWVGRLYAHVLTVEDNVALGKQRLILNTEGRQGLPQRIRLSRPLVDEREPIFPGDVIAVKARLMPPATAAFPGAYDFAQRAYFEGWGATGSVLGNVRLVGRQDKARGKTLRTRLADNVRENITGDAGAIAATLASGDRSGISAAASEDMRRAGMAHLLSISGLHVTAVVGAVFLLLLRGLAAFPHLALRWNLPLIAAGGGALAAIFYTWLTGAAVPTIRSCIAALLILAALASGRDPISLRLVAIAATLVLLVLPETLVGPSFQLSFAAVAAIIPLHDSKPIRRLREREKRSLTKLGSAVLMLFLTGLAVEATLAPIALYHFHETGLYGALANIAAIPLTTFAIMPLLAVALVADVFGLGAPFWGGASIMLDVLLLVAREAAHAPGANILTASIPQIAFLTYIIGILMLFLLTGRARLAGLAAIAADCSSMLLSEPPDMLIDGSGRHVVLRGEDGHFYSVRSGGGEFMRDLIAEQIGMRMELDQFDDLKGASCSPDACLIRAPVGSGEAEESRPSLLVTRSNRWLDYEQFIAACSSVDIVVSDRSLPKACAPKWLKADRRLLRETGGLALRFDRHSIKTVADEQAHLPWSHLNTAAIAGFSGVADR